MKIRFTLFLSFLSFFIFNADAQITEESKSMSLGVRNAFVLEIPDTKASFVDKLWKKYIKTYGGKTKKTRGSNEVFTDDAEVVAMGGANTIDIYASSDDRGEGSNLTMWVDLGGAFLASETHPDRYMEGEKFLMRFALFVAKENTVIELEEEEKQFKRLQANLKRLERDNERYHREIEQAKETIRKAEAGIETNLLDQEETNQQIEIQQGVLDAVKKRLSELD